jgi:HK97 family phage major capsid protein
MSKSIQALRERLAASNQAMNKLLADVGSRSWTKEEQATFDNHGEECERITTQIAAHERQLQTSREMNHTDAEEFRMSASDRKFELSDSQKALNIFLRKSFKDMSVEDAQLIRNTMSTTTGSEGGFSVQSDVASTLIDYAKAYGYMRKVAGNIRTSQGNNLSYPTTDGTSETGEWIAQNVTATNADPVFGTVALNVFKASSKVIVVPIELLQDSTIDIQRMVMKRLGQRIGRISNTGYTVGTGTGQPNGIVTAASVGKTGTTGQTLTITYDDLVDMIESLDAAYLGESGTAEDTPGADGWMMSQSMRKVIRKLKDTSGRPIWTPSYDNGISGKFADTLMGYNVFLNNDMAAPAANAKSLAFGNYGNYMIRDAMDVTMFRFDDSAYMKLGQVGFLAWARTGGNLLDVQSVKLYQHSAT